MTIYVGNAVNGHIVWHPQTTWHVAAPSWAVQKKPSPPPPPDPMQPLRNLAEAVALPAALLWLREEWAARTGGRGTMTWDCICRQDGEVCASVEFAIDGFKSFDNCTFLDANRRGLEDTIEPLWRKYGKHLAERHRRAPG